MILPWSRHGKGYGKPWNKGKGEDGNGYGKPRGREAQKGTATHGRHMSCFDEAQYATMEDGDCDWSYYINEAWSGNPGQQVNSMDG